jgi:hypothetical protein
MNFFKELDEDFLAIKLLLSLFGTALNKGDR